MQDVIIIEAGRRERHYWLDLWRYRELFRVLAWRDLSVRYKQTVIGVLWALIRPVLTMLVFTIIFGQIARLPSDGTAPYPLMVLAGILPWTFFSTGLSEASNSLINNAHLISKVYFPRLIVPTASVVVAFVDFLISFSILVLMMGWYQFLPGWQILVLPLFVLLAILCKHRSGAVDHCSQRQVSGFPFIVQSGYTYRRSASVRAWCLSNGVCCMPSIRWWGSLMGFAGAFWADKATFMRQAWP
jgi:hypothetical protein